MSAAQTWEVRARLVALNAPFQGRIFPIVLFPAVIGRGSECAIYLDNASVSRQHAVIEERNGGFFIRDLGSRNGIKVGDQLVQEAGLQGGEIVTIGDVQLRFEPLAPGAETAAGAESGARTVTGQDVVSLLQAGLPAGAASGQPTAEGAPELQPRVGLNLKMIAVIVGALIVSICIGALILRYRGGVGALTAQWPAVLVKVGEKKWIQISTLQTIKVGTDTWWTPEDLYDRDVRDIVIGGAQGPGAAAGGDNGDMIIGVQKYDPGEILITGKSVGATTLTITLDNGHVLKMRVVVRGRLEDPLEPLLYGRYTAPERVAMAEQFLNNGILAEKAQPYLALQEYQKARAVLTPLPDANKGDLYYLQIVPRLTLMQKKVDDLWDALGKKITVAVNSKDLTTAIQRCQEAVKLIPDPNDPRHQKAEGMLHTLIRIQLAQRQ